MTIEACYYHKEGEDVSHQCKSEYTYYLKWKEDHCSRFRVGVVKESRPKPFVIPCRCLQ